MSDPFESFWSAFPKKMAKADARKAWNQTAQIRPDIQLLLTALSDQCKSDQWQRHIIPHAGTWLRGERWNDVMEVKLPTTRRPDKFDLANLELASRAAPEVDPETRARVAEKLKSLRIKGAVA